MKTHPVSVCLAVAASVALVVAVCAIAQTHAPGMAIQETAVKIHPGTKISSDDQKALDAVLKKYREQLYKIKTYDHGKVVKTQGRLEDARLDQTLVAETNQAALRGVSLIALQIGHEHWPSGAMGSPEPTNTPFDNSPNKQLGPTTPPPPPPNKNTVLNPMEVRGLVRSVAPILQKYSQ